MDVAKVIVSPKAFRSVRFLSTRGSTASKLTEKIFQICIVPIGFFFFFFSRGLFKIGCCKAEVIENPFGSAVSCRRINGYGEVMGDGITLLENLNQF